VVVNGESPWGWTGSSGIESPVASALSPLVPVASRAPPSRRKADAALVQRLDLALQQIQVGPQARMPLGPVGIVVEVAVMALGEDRHAVDVSAGHGVPEGLRIEFRADIRDLRSGMEIEVDLTGGQGGFHESSLSG
jgi:hypothetical protein